jgi:acyl-CoA thioester hydrolase/thioesterase-3
MQTESIILVTQAHCDELGHLNHVEAVRYLETAREDWYRACGLYEGAEGLLLFAAVVVNINYNYRLECFLGERLSAMTRPVSMGTKSFTLAHEIVKPDGGIAISGEATSCIMDMKARAIIPVPACMARHLPKR